MVKKEVIDKITKGMFNTKNIRNISVIAHVDHGKSTLTDSLVCAADLMNKEQAGQTRWTDTREDEKARTITIKSTGVSLPFDFLVKKVKQNEKKAKKEKKETEKKDDEVDIIEEVIEEKLTLSDKDKDNKDNKEIDKKNEVFTADHSDKQIDSFIVNLIDSPGHVDFSSEVTAALRLTDGALVVVDSVESVCIQTETVLRQAITERVKPVLFMNKLDRIFFELNLGSSPDDCECVYQRLVRSIESVNVVISTYHDDLLGDVTVYPQAGTVGFGSGLQGWGFTLTQFADVYFKRFNLSREKMREKLWGDNFYDLKTKTWTKEALTEKGKKRERGFNMLIIKPLAMLFEAGKDGDINKLQLFIKKFDIKINITSDEIKLLRGKDLIKKIIQQWLPASTALLDLIINHLPNPIQSQSYRVGNLYSGPQDDVCARAIAHCDQKGPLMVYISKMVPIADNSRFVAFGRVFAGTCEPGSAIRIQGPDYIPGEKKDVVSKSLQSVLLMMGPYQENMSALPCGMMVGLTGVDSYLLKTGTVTSSSTAHNFNVMKYTVSPIVRVAVSVEKPQDLHKLNQGLRRLTKSDPLVQTYLAPNGEHIVAGCGELHLEICLKDLEQDFMKGVVLKKSDPVVSFCETVTKKSSTIAIGKSPNKHNRLYVEATPLGEDFCRALDNGQLFADVRANDTEGRKSQAAKLVSDYKWDPNDAKKIWTFGIGDGVCNVFVDRTRGVAYRPEIKDHVASAFKEASLSGVYAHESLRGCRFDLLDCKLHSDSIHRGVGQIVPATRDALYASQISSSPALMEPIYMCDIVVPRAFCTGVYNTLRARRGIVLGAEDDQKNTKSDLTKIQAYLPVLESFGFTEDLRKNTSGQAFPQLIFSHWAITPGDLTDESSKSYSLLMDIRKRKGLKEELPLFDDFHAKDIKQ